MFLVQALFNDLSLKFYITNKTVHIFDRIAETKLGPLLQATAAKNTAMGKIYFSYIFYFK